MLADSVIWDQQLVGMSMGLLPAGRALPISVPTSPEHGRACRYGDYKGITARNRVIVFGRTST